MRRSAGAVIALVAVATAWAAAPAWVSAQGGSGTIEVEVKYGGASQIDKIKVNRDTQQCGTEAEVDKLVVGANKGVQYAVVSVPSAKGGTPRTKATIDQQGCKFVPRVIAVNAPAELELRNSDGILHNVHTYSTANPTINRAQPKFRKSMTVKLEKPEIVKLGCDVHSWMLAWVAVLPTPYFGVTDASGTTRIDGVPAGKQTVEVWHEVLGKQTREVDVKSGQTTRVTLEMKR